MKRFFCMAAAVVLAGIAQVSATTTLGVATDGYAYDDPSAMNDEYIKYFAGDNFQPVAPGYEHGFMIGGSGSNLTVFSLYDPSVTDVYLMAAATLDNNPISFGGESMSSFADITQIDGYMNKPYQGVLLPKDTGLWSTHIFDSSKTFYLYTAAVNYSGELAPGDYFFATADINGEAGLQFIGTKGGTKDDFSPKTTSATGVPIPEPGTMALFGSGLAALLGMVAYKKQKSA